MAAQAAEQARAEAANVAQTQAGINVDMVAQRRRFGSLAQSFGGSAPLPLVGVSAAAKNAAVGA